MPSAAGPLSRRRVLLIEDEYFIADDLARALTAKGAEVVGPVATVASAMRLVGEAGHLDGAVLDINLRGEMAYSIADALRERGVPFIFATGYDDLSIPPRFADIVRCEKPIAPNLVAKALFGAA